MLNRRIYYWILSFLLSISLFVRIFLTLFRRFNVDEFQHLHASWMVHLGHLPYRDFWENHAPLLYFLFAPVLAFFGEGVPAVLVARGILSVLGIAIAVVVYRIARLDCSKETALLAVVVLSFSEIFLQKSIEFRTDQFLVLFWLISLYFCLCSFKTQKDHFLLIAGLSLGIGMLFSPKALVCLASAAILIFIKNRKIKSPIYFLLGFALPMIPLAIYFQSQHALTHLVEATILQNLSYPHTRGPSFLLLPQNLSFLLLAFSGVYLSIKNKDSVLLFLPGLILLCLLVFLMPSPFSQSALIIWPIFAIYGGVAVERSLVTRNPVFLAFTLASALLIPLISLGLRNSFAITNTNQLDLVEHILNHTKKEELIFDGNSAYIFRNQAYFYGSLVEGIRHKIRRGEIQESIIESLKKHPCRVVIYDDRVSDLPEPIQNFIRSNYLPAGKLDVYIAGKELSAENISGNRASFWIELPLQYRIYADKPANLDLDGEPYQGSVFLNRGNHQLVSNRTLNRVLIRAD